MRGGGTVGTVTGGRWSVRVEDEIRIGADDVLLEVAQEFAQRSAGWTKKPSYYQLRNQRVKIDRNPQE